MDVAEVFSPPRLTQRAREFGPRAGFVVDLSTERRRGEHWELSLQSHVKALGRLIRKEKPALLFVSPPCTDFCGLLRLTHTAEEMKARQEARGEPHLKNAMKVCSIINRMPQSRAS